MQYILTEEEYQNLKKVQTDSILKKTKELQTLCTKIADEMPITIDWGPWKEAPTPWGCIHSAEDEWYCDSCPVQKICPEKHKSWSQ